MINTKEILETLSAQTDYIYIFEQNFQEFLENSECK